MCAFITTEDAVLVDAIDRTYAKGVEGPTKRRIVNQWRKKTSDYQLPIQVQNDSGGPGNIVSSQTTPDGELCQRGEPINYTGDSVQSSHLEWYQLPLTTRIADNHHIGGNKTDLNLIGWQHELSFETDESLQIYLDKGVREGFKIIDSNAVIAGYDCANYTSVLQGEPFDCINKLIEKEVKEGKYIATDVKPIAIHALGAVSKKDSGYRPITDCKRPLTLSVNNYMSTTHQQFCFAKIDDVADLMQKNMYMSSVDISSAYRTVNIHPSDYQYQGIRWEHSGKSQYYT